MKKEKRSPLNINVYRNGWHLFRTLFSTFRPYLEKTDKQPVLSELVRVKLMTMTESLKNQVAIVTGAATGIGFEIANQLARAGASVILNDIDALQAQTAADRISLDGATCHPFPGDAGDVEFINRMVDFAVKQFGKLNLVVANAGITLIKDFSEVQPKEFERLVNLNLRGTFFLVQAATKVLKRQGTGGSFVLMSSVTGVRAHPSFAAYAMTKAAISMLVNALVLELAPHGITINAVAPGATLTERTELELPDYEASWSKVIPTGRVAQPADIANATLFLLSQAARHITGQMLLVDGGQMSVSSLPE